METQPAPASLSPKPATAPDLTGLNLMMIALVIPVIYLVMPKLGIAGAVAIVGASLLLIAYQLPVVFMLMLVLVAPFNLAQQVGPASVKLTEVVTMIMGGLIFWRIAVLDFDVHRRLQHLALPFALLALVACMAVLTASAHPNFFNIRYELQNYLAFAFGALFFKRKYWPMLSRSFLVSLLLAAGAALLIRFVFKLHAVSFFAQDGPVTTLGISAQEVEMLSGGRFRLAGTFGHKNILAAFIILLGPLAAMELLRKFTLTRVMCLIPVLITLALTDSMTGWGAFVLIIAMVLLHLRRFDYLLIMLLLMLPLGAAALAKFGDTIFFRIDQLLNTSSGWGTVSSRGYIYHLSLDLISRYPFLGIGRNNFMAYANTYYTHAHNLYLMKIIEMGILAGVVFSLWLLGLLCFGYLKILFRKKRLERDGQYFRFFGLWLGCMGFMAMNTLDYSYSNFALGPLFMFCMGVMLAVGLNLDARPTSGRERRRRTRLTPGGHVPGP